MADRWSAPEEPPAATGVPKHAPRRAQVIYIAIALATLAMIGAAIFTRP
jgi:hypothetical protein